LPRRRVFIHIASDVGDVTVEADQHPAVRDRPTGQLVVQEDQIAFLEAIGAEKHHGKHTRRDSLPAKASHPSLQFKPAACRKQSKGRKKMNKIVPVNPSPACAPHERRKDPQAHPPVAKRTPPRPALWAQPPQRRPCSPSRKSKERQVV